MKFLLKINTVQAAVLILICCTPGPVFAGIVNGGFESNFDSWTIKGDVSISSVALIDAVVFSPYEGDKMAGLGYYDRSNYSWENAISQELTLTEDDEFLNFYYNFWTLDEAPFDNPGFMVTVNGKTEFFVQAGEIGDTLGIGDDILGTLDYTGWQLVTIGLSEYYSADPNRPATIEIAFSAGNTGDTNPDYASGVFIDSISTTATPIPGGALLLLSGLLGFGWLRWKT